MTEAVEYQWHYNTAYYVTVTHRYYQQLPFILHLPIQFGMLWVIGVVIYSIYSTATGDLPAHFALWAILGGAAIIPIGTFVTKRAILLKYRRRPSFNSECTYRMSEAEMSIFSKSVRGSFGWSEYSRAVRFSDGILLLRKGTIRWLPDSAVRVGAPAQATELVRARLPMRTMK